GAELAPAVLWRLPAAIRGHSLDDDQRGRRSVARSERVTMALAREDAAAAIAKAAEVGSARLPPCALLPRPDAQGRDHARRSARARRRGKTALSDERRRAQAPLLRHYERQSPKVGDPQSHHLWLDGGAVRMLRRSRTAGVSLGGHAALDGMDRL